ncbi:lysophospholipid acyltransferase family protein, partial [Frankia sp. AgKG'84/4]|uniref:lysophospholipid acyltransferase family protein n=1 Tax=Frankia sp. AgKG'84/4 TaxID=573490 RepID=UPI0035B11B92
RRVRGFERQRGDGGRAAGRRPPGARPVRRRRARVQPGVPARRRAPSRDLPARDVPAGEPMDAGPTGVDRRVPEQPSQGPDPADGREGSGIDDSDEPAAAVAGELEAALAGMLAFVRRRITGDYVIDEHGFDADLTEHLLAPLLRPVYRDYFRVETRGLENIPDTGGALVVANHSGTLPVDALMMAMAILDHHPAHRNLRMLAADLVFAVPFLAPFARKIGNTLACQPDAERLLRAGHLVGVWPEGFKGVGKPFRERYTLQRFGRGGFVSAALRTGVPIIPCTVVGAEEIYPMIGNARSLARLLGLPYLPITPTFPWLGLLGLVPLPSKWFIEFGEPVPTDGYPPEAADDPMLVFELTDSIRETIQHTLYSLLMERRSVFF